MNAMSRGGRKTASKPALAERREVFQELVEDGVMQEVKEVEDMEPGSIEPTLADLTNLFRAHMAKMDAQETHRNQEYVQQEQRFKALQHQFSLLQPEVQARTTQTPNPLLTAGDPLEVPEDEEVVLGRPLSLSTTGRRYLSETKSQDLRSYLNLMRLNTS